MMCGLDSLPYDGVTSNLTTSPVLYYSNITSTERSSAGVLSMCSVIFPWYGSQVPGISWHWLPSDQKYDMISFIIRIS